jgi:hypothetical protein
MKQENSHAKAENQEASSRQPEKLELLEQALPVAKDVGIPRLYDDSFTSVVYTFQFRRIAGCSP